MMIISVYDSIDDLDLNDKKGKQQCCNNMVLNQKLCVLPRVGLTVVSPSRCTTNPAYVHLAREEEASEPPTRGKLANERILNSYHTMVINFHFLEESSLLISQSQCTKNPAYIDLAQEVGKNKILTAPPNGN